MDCKELGKILSDLEYFPDNTKNKLEQCYKEKHDNYDFTEIQNKLKNKKINIPNYYEQAKENWSSPQYINSTRTAKINYIFWQFLFFSQKSKKDLGILDYLIKSFCMNCTLSLNSRKFLDECIRNSEPASTFLKENGFGSYSELSKHFQVQYGIDIEDYENAYSHNFQISSEDNLTSDTSDNKEFSINRIKKSQKIIVNSLSKNRESLFSEDGIVDEELLGKELKYSHICPHYVQRYSYPLLTFLKSNQIIFEFSILDSTNEIYQQINNIFDIENGNCHIKNRTRNNKLYTSEKWQLLKQFLPTEDCSSALGTIDMLQKALVLYQYYNNCGQYTKARLVYNFHVFSSMPTQQNDETEWMATSPDFITLNTMKSDLSKNINFIIKLLNLT